MRILRTLLWTFVALSCAAPTCDTHDGSPGSGSGSSAWARMPSTAATSLADSPAPAGSAAQHQDVVHAISKHRRGGTSSPTPTPPPEPELPSSGRRIGQPCVANEQCASGSCEIEYCVRKYADGLNKGEKCSRNSECNSNTCDGDECQ
ncbi:MAG TPA: hypothetical protein VFQ65_17125 [Kofleriaceae bacterium]|nr:hypothetical protein [Kofleriaceae bacterium]